VQISQDMVFLQPFCTRNHDGGAWYVCYRLSSTQYVLEYMRWCTTLL